MKQQLDLFAANLPHRPFCTDDLTSGLVVRAASQALLRRYLQYNPPHVDAWLAFDVDAPASLLGFPLTRWLTLDTNIVRMYWERIVEPRIGCPLPSLIVANPNNGHAHLLYALATPVCTTDAARQGPLRYAAAVQYAMTVALSADPGFAHLVTKNPLHEHWHVHALAAEPYSLEQLSTRLTLPKRVPAREALGLGRNCTLFDSVRRWAYRWVLTYKAGNASCDAFMVALLGQLEAANTQFCVPLPNSELRAIAKSIAKWTWVRFTEKSFSAIQSARGKKRAAATNAKRWGDGTSAEATRPWEALGVSRATYYRRKATGEL